MKIATFNANSIRSRLEPVLAWLAQHQPDALCVQETKVQDHEFPRAPFEAAGYQVAFRGEKAYNGVALLTRTAPTEVRFGFDDGGPADETRLLHARLGPLHLLNTYVPQGRELDHPMFPYKLAWFQRLRAYCARHCTPQDLVLWTGDLNVAATPLDVHSPEQYAQHVCFHASVREAFATCCAWGFVDCFRRHHPEPGQYTFFDYRTPHAVDRGIGWRLDYLLATTPLAERCRRVEIDLAPRRAPKPSDHTFVCGEFDV